MGNRNQVFGSSSTAEQVAEGVDLSGKIAIITGANTGIGQETARVLAIHGAVVIMGCRDTTKGQKAKEDILKSVAKTVNEEKKDSPNDEKKDLPISESKGSNEKDFEQRVQVMKLDLDSLQSVRDFASQFLQNYHELHYLINNAGIMADPEYKLSKDNYELQFATNHLGHYYLIRLLIPTMLKTKGKSRVVQVASEAHNRSPNPFKAVVNDFAKRKDGPAKEGYDGWRNYGISKACNVLCGRHVNTLYSQQENGIYGVSLHPGVIITELWKNVPSAIQWTLKKLGKAFIKNVPQGAATSVRCVCISDEELDGGGQYYVDCNAHNDKLRQDIRLQTAKEEETMDVVLWKVSEELIVARGYSMSLEEESKAIDTTEQKQPEEEKILTTESEEKQNDQLSNEKEEIVVESDTKPSDASA